MKDWVKVYSTVSVHTAQMIQLYLEENQLDVVCLNKQDSNYFFGEVELYVPQIQFNLAIELIISYEL